MGISIGVCLMKSSIDDIWFLCHGEIRLSRPRSMRASGYLAINASFRLRHLDMTCRMIIAVSRLAEGLPVLRIVCIMLASGR